jgi:hypothetical protein
MGVNLEEAMDDFGNLAIPGASCECSDGFTYATYATVEQRELQNLSLDPYGGIGTYGYGYYDI